MRAAFDNKRPDLAVAYARQAADNPSLLLFHADCLSIPLASPSSPQHAMHAKHPAVKVSSMQKPHSGTEPYPTHCPNASGDVVSRFWAWALFCSQAGCTGWTTMAMVLPPCSKQTGNRPERCDAL